MWCGVRPLKEDFPFFFDLALNKDAWVADYLVWVNDSYSWNVALVRNFQDWELDDVLSFLGNIYDIKIYRGELDQILWKGARRGEFSVKHYFKSLMGTAGISFPAANTWVTNVPSKVCFFTWIACWGKCLTIDNLQRRGFHLPNWCVLCKKDRETVEHFLIHCEVTYQLWVFYLSFFGMYWIMPKRVIELVASWRCTSRNKVALRVWRLVPHVIFWTVWRERNNRVFNDKEDTVAGLKILIADLIFTWGDTPNFCLRKPLTDFLRSLTL